MILLILNLPSLFLFFANKLTPTLLTWRQQSLAVKFSNKQDFQLQLMCVLVYSLLGVRLLSAVFLQCFVARLVEVPNNNMFEAVCQHWCLFSNIIPCQLGVQHLRSSSISLWRFFQKDHCRETINEQLRTCWNLVFLLLTIHSARVFVIVLWLFCHTFAIMTEKLWRKPHSSVRKFCDLFPTCVLLNNINLTSLLWTIWSIKYQSTPCSSSRNSLTSITTCLTSQTSLCTLTSSPFSTHSSQLLHKIELNHTFPNFCCCWQTLNCWQRDLVVMPNNLVVMPNNLVTWTRKLRVKSCCHCSQLSNKNFENWILISSICCKMKLRMCGTNLGSNFHLNWIPVKKELVLRVDAVFSTCFFSFLLFFDFYLFLPTQTNQNSKITNPNQNLWPTLRCWFCGDCVLFLVDI